MSSQDTVEDLTFNIIKSLEDHRDQSTTDSEPRHSSCSTSFVPHIQEETDQKGHVRVQSQNTADTYSYKALLERRPEPVKELGPDLCKFHECNTVADSPHNVSKQPKHSEDYCITNIGRIPTETSSCSRKRKLSEVLHGEKDPVYRRTDDGKHRSKRGRKFLKNKQSRKRK